MKKTITISSGHSKYVSGAKSIVDEVEQARIITNAIALALESTMNVNVFHDDKSRTQRDNINTIVNYHNSTKRIGDYSIHLNASGAVTKDDKGVEVLYYADKNKQHAVDLAKAISDATGMKNRGAKKRTDLGFLRNTNVSSWLIEAYFVNSKADVDKMNEVSEIEKFALAVAETIAKFNGLKLASKTEIKKFTETHAGATYRIKTGTFANERAAINGAEKIRNVLGVKTVYTIPNGKGLWYLQSGAWTDKAKFEQAKDKLYKATNWTLHTVVS